MPVQPAALELLAAVAPVLARWGRWYLFGAQAVIIYGVPRLSADVDVTLALAPDAPERFAADMQTAGFALAVDDPDLLRRTAGSGLEDEFLERAVPTDVGGTRVPLIEAGDLIIAKVLAGRPKDLDDARGVWRVRGETLDAGRIRTILGLLEEALSQDDLVSTFDEIAGAPNSR